MITEQPKTLSGMSDPAPVNKRLEKKPQGPSELFIRFRCVCGQEHIATEYYGDWYDLGADSLDLLCRCGQYYKKTGRIPEDSVVDRWYEELPPLTGNSIIVTEIPH